MISPERTKSGKHIAFHQDNCPYAKAGKEVPQEFLDEGGPYFYMLTEGNTTAVGRLRKYPLIYSPGFKTMAEAVQAAEEWEDRAVNFDYEEATVLAIFGKPDLDLTGA